MHVNEIFPGGSKWLRDETVDCTTYERVSARDFQVSAAQIYKFLNGIFQNGTID